MSRETVMPLGSAFQIAFDEVCITPKTPRRRHDQGDDSNDRRDGAGRFAGRAGDRVFDSSIGTQLCLTSGNGLRFI
jgi:hypothetical protein